jgi:integrase
MGKLNAKFIEHAKPKEKEYRVPDGEGLFIRIRPSGAKSWLFCFRLSKSRTWLQMTLGSLKDLSLKEARDQLKELRRLVANGIDPRNARAAMKAENTQAISMQILFDSWIEYIKITNEVSITWVKRHEDRWRLHLKKALENILVRDVTRAHLSGALDTMTRKGIKEETRKALTTLNLMLDYALTRHFIESNPARMLKPKDFSATAAKPRDRVLTLLELRELWGVLDQANDLSDEGNGISKMSVITTSAIKLLILTGARRGEVAGMRWSELNLETKEWMLPAERTKNRQLHTIYLSELAIEILNALQRLSGHSSFVFDTGRYENEGHIHEDSLTGVIGRLRGSVKGMKKKSYIEAPLADMPTFTIHDLRRSAATAWGEYLKTDPHVIERMLNHQPANKLIATYQRATYVDEQKNAWLKWGELVEQRIAKDPHNLLMFAKSVSR